MKTILTRSSEQTRSLGKMTARKLRGTETLALYGELGTGKTEFVKGLAAGLGIKKNITSPTFVLLNRYNFKKHGKKIPFYHLDLYRLANKSEATLFGAKEILADGKRVAVIEWPQKAKKSLPANTITIRFAYGKKENERKIHLSSAVI